MKAVPPRSSSPPRPDQRSATAEQLLNSTAALLCTRSGLDVSLADIAAHSGLNSALIKYYFGNKEGLLMCLLERDAAIALSALRQLISAPMTAAQKLRWHIRGIINTYFKMPYLNRLIHHMLHHGSAENAQRVGEIFIDPMIEAYRQIIAQGAQEASIKIVDPILLYYGLVGSCDHLFYATQSRHRLLGTTEISPAIKENYAVMVEDMCLRGLEMNAAPARA